MSVEPILISEVAFQKCTQIPESHVNRTINTEPEWELRDCSPYQEDPNTRFEQGSYAIDVLHLGKTGIVKPSPMYPEFKNQKNNSGYTTAFDPIAVIGMKNKLAITNNRFAEEQENAMDYIGYDPASDVKYVQENVNKLVKMSGKLGSKNKITEQYRPVKRDIKHEAITNVMNSSSGGGGGGGGSGFMETFAPIYEARRQMTEEFVKKGVPSRTSTMESGYGTASLPSYQSYPQSEGGASDITTRGKWGFHR